MGKDLLHILEEARSALAAGRFPAIVSAYEQALGGDIEDPQLVEDHSGELLYLRALAFQAADDPRMAFAVLHAARNAQNHVLSILREDEHTTRMLAQRVLAQIDEALALHRKAENLVDDAGRDALIGKFSTWAHGLQNGCWVVAEGAMFAAADALSDQVSELQAPLDWIVGRIIGDSVRLQRATALAPDSRIAWLELMRHFLLSGEVEGAASAMLALLSLDPASSPTSPGARSLEQMRFPTPAELRTELESALDEIFDAELLVAAGDIADRLVKLHPDALKAWLIRADARTFSMRTAEASQAYEECVNAFAATPDAELRYGVEQFTEMRALANFNRACVLAKLGDRDAALDALREAANFDPSAPSNALDDDDFAAYANDPELKALAAKSSS